MKSMEPEEARQGKEGKPVLGILIAALALCVVGAVGLATYAWIMPDQTLQEAPPTEGSAVPAAPAGDQNAPDGGSTPTVPDSAPAATEPSSSN